MRLRSKPLQAPIKIQSERIHGRNLAPNIIPRKFSSEVVDDPPFQKSSADCQAQDVLRQFGIASAILHLSSHQFTRPKKKSSLDRKVLWNRCLGGDLLKAHQGAKGMAHNRTAHPTPRWTADMLSHLQSASHGCGTSSAIWPRPETESWHQTSRPKQKNNVSAWIVLGLVWFCPQHKSTEAVNCECRSQKERQCMDCFWENEGWYGLCPNQLVNCGSRSQAATSSGSTDLPKPFSMSLTYTTALICRQPWRTSVSVSSLTSWLSSHFLRSASSLSGSFRNRTCSKHQSEKGFVFGTWIGLVEGSV